MSAIDVRIDGLVEALADLEGALDEDLQQGILRAAQLVADEAAAHHEYKNRTGALQANTQAGVVRGRASDGEITAEVLGDTDYGEFVEAKMPFLKPAAERAADQAADELESALERAAARAGWA